MTAICPKSLEAVFGTLESETPFHPMKRKFPLD